MTQPIQLIKFRKPEDIRSDEIIGKVLFTDNLNTKSILDFCLEKKIDHVVQMSNLDHTHELEVALKISQNPTEYFDFPLSTLILCPEKGNLEKEFELRKVYFEIERPDQKEEMLSKMEAYLKDNTNSKSLISDILSVADELFTNAIFNAPFVDLESNQFPIDRKISEVSVNKEKRPYLFISNDFERIILGCCDHYGSLNVPRLLGRVRKCYETGVAEMINYSIGGAGVGSYLILEKSTSVYLGVQKGKRTTICCAFPLIHNSVKRAQMPKNLHLCQI